MGDKRSIICACLLTTRQCEVIFAQPSLFKLGLQRVGALKNSQDNKINPWSWTESKALNNALIQCGTATIGKVVILNSQVIIWLEIAASKGIISTANPVFHMNRLICRHWAYIFTHSEGILDKKFCLLHHQHCPDFSRCWFIACSYSYLPSVFPALSHGIDGLFEIVPFSRYFHCTLALSVWTSHL